MSRKRISEKKRSYKRNKRNTNAEMKKATTNDIKSKTIFHNPVLSAYAVLIRRFQNFI